MSKWLPPGGGGYTGARETPRTSLWSRLRGRGAVVEPPSRGVPRPPKGGSGVSRASE